MFDRRHEWSRVVDHRRHWGNISFQFPVSNCGEVTELFKDVGCSLPWLPNTLSDCHNAPPLPQFPLQSAVRAGRAGWFQPRPQWAHCPPWSLQSSVCPKTKKWVNISRDKRILSECQDCPGGLILPNVSATNAASATLTFSQPTYRGHRQEQLTPGIFGGPSVYLKRGKKSN